eukprot:TRINITY_DN29608_c0_g1_i2.p1 TRINITY_DN29608_c0_g1~~TRINITY_DN29608_c0_g1_i2.p1  ORF type:complete len:634 (+),score=115.37 TRINITY_DN29608_c0_g1_i2:80-1981(+)
MGGRLSAQRDSEGLPEGEGSNGADAAQKLVLKDPAPVHLGRPLDIDIRHLDARGWPRHGHLATASSERRCTDIVCLFTFLAYLGGLVAIFLVSRRDGDLAKLTHGFDFQGRVCGVDAGVRDLPLLYWCSTAQPDTLLEGICVARCPGEADVSAGTQSWCPGPPRAFEQEQSLATGSTLREVVVGTRRNLTLTPNHASIEALGYCFPAHDVALLQGVLERSPAAAATRQLLLAVHGALESWRFLVAAGCSCICAGYIFLFVLWMCFEPLVYGLLGILHLALLGACAAFVAVGIQPDRGFLAGYISVKATATCAWAGAVLSLGMWLALAVLSCRGREQVRAAVGTVRLTCDVVARMPGLLLQPLLHSLAVVALLLTLVWGLAWVLSTGRVVPYLEAAPTSPASKGAAGSGGSLDFGLGFGLELDGLGDRVAVGGVRRCFELSGAQWSLVVYWLFGILWIVETLSALGQFAVAHAVVGRACLGLDGATKSTSELKVLFAAWWISVAAFMGRLQNAGYWVNMVDICPESAATIMGISNTVGTIPGIIGQPITQTVLESSGGDHSTDAWSIVFAIGGAVGALGALTFCCFGDDVSLDKPSVPADTNGNSVPSGTVEDRYANGNVSECNIVEGAPLNAA